MPAVSQLFQNNVIEMRKRVLSTYLHYYLLCVCVCGYVSACVSARACVCVGISDRAPNEECNSDHAHAEEDVLQSKYLVLLLF